MENSHDKHTHTQTETTIRANAGYWPFSCSFFCNRISDKDVVDPQETKAAAEALPLADVKPSSK